VAIEPKTGEPQIVQPSTLPGSKAACKLCISALLGARYHKQQDFQTSGFLSYTAAPLLNKYLSFRLSSRSPSHF